MDYRIIDADNHYYEATDAFQRYGDEEVRGFVRWFQEGKKRRLIFGNQVSNEPPNPTFNPVAKPGAYHLRLKELHQRGKTAAAPEASASSTATVSQLSYGKDVYGELEPLPLAYHDRSERLAVMDEQGVERSFLFPTLGSSVEGQFRSNIVMAHKAFHAFNQWLDEDWGFNHHDRIYAPPYIPLSDPAMAVDELDFVLDRGAKIVSVRPGPAAGRSPADPVWDPFWARVNEAGIVVAYHATGGPDDYQAAFESLWGRQPITDYRYHLTLWRALASDRAVLDTMIALVLGNLFGRFPNVRVASIENGCGWVDYCLHALDHAGGLIERHIEAFGTTVDDRPSDIFREKVWVSPFPEEDVVGLTGLIGVDRVLFGSDWPHPEGTVTPADYADCIQKLDSADVEKIMRTNALSLLSPP
ncbi:MAG TPA: amidohydrolase family protein [Acidimicrobiales bacterium]